VYVYLNKYLILLVGESGTHISVHIEGQNKM